MQTDDVVKIIVRSLLDRIADGEEKLSLMRREREELYNRIENLCLQLREAREKETKK
ncbi:MAG: hypothetical protein ACOVKO_03535 [Elstera sp.]|jgi:hypothetical protein